MLSDVQLRTLKTPGKHFDGGGLYLEVTPAGGRYWRLKYRHGGKERRLAFGVYPEVSLKAARERRAEARAILDRGADPGALKREEKAKAERESAATLEAVAREWLSHQATGWTAGTLAAIRAKAWRPSYSPSWAPDRWRSFAPATCCPSSRPWRSAALPKPPAGCCSASRPFSGMPWCTSGSSPTRCWT
jgi:hypothetical protein